MKRLLLALSVALLPAALLTGCHDQTSDPLAPDGLEMLAAKAAKTTICHFPPGNPLNGHEISVSGNALAAHLAHGDILGECTPPTLYGVNSSDDGLSSYDLATGAATFIGPLHPDPLKYVTPIAMAVHPADGTIFVWNNSDQLPSIPGDPGPVPTISTGVLLTVDPSTGLGTPVDETTPFQGQLAAMAFAPDGTLFGLGGALYEIDPATGVRTWIADLDVRIGGADFDAGGTLYGVELVLGSERLVTIDTTTGAATVIGTLTPGIGTIGSIVFDPDGNLIGSAFSPSELFDLDVSTGATSNFRTIPGGAFAPQGLGFAR